MSVDDGDDEECDLGWSIGMALRDYRAVVEPVMSDFPRGARGYQLLHTVARKRIRTQVQLADYLGVDRSVIPYVVDDLVEAGLVDRRPDASDRRVRTVVVTDRGLERLRELETRLRDAESKFFAALEHDEEQQFRALLGRVARRARDDGIGSGHGAEAESV